MISKYITSMLGSYYHPSSVIGEEDEHEEDERKGNISQHTPLPPPPQPIDYELNYITKDKEQEGVDAPLF